jgi:chaperonin cofactor prefoldin
VTDQTPEIPYRRIGTILVEWRLLDERELERALAEQEESGRLLGEILVTSYGISRVDLADALAEQWQEANKAAAAAIEQRSSLPADTAEASAAESFAEADLRVLLDEAEAARAELSVRTEELGRRLATLETLVVGVTEALDELRSVTAPDGHQERQPQLPASRRTRVRAGTRTQGPRNSA